MNDDLKCTFCGGSGHRASRCPRRNPDMLAVALDEGEANDQAPSVLPRSPYFAHQLGEDDGSPD